MAPDLPVLDVFRRRIEGLGWVTDVLVGGSAATGDHRPGVSDLDLVALVDGPMDDGRLQEVASLHRTLDAGAGRGLDLGCVYVESALVDDLAARHPTWTHGRLVHRRLSAVARAELVRHGFALLGREPRAVLPPVSDEEVRAGVRSELDGYWTWAIRRPWLWLDPKIADLALVTMARARHALANGQLVTKSAAIDLVHAPPSLVDQLRHRRTGAPVRSPRMRTGVVAWRDAVRTVRAAGGGWATGPAPERVADAPPTRPPPGQR